MAVTPGTVGAYQRYMAALWDERATVGVPTLFQTIFYELSRNGGQTIFSDDAEVVDIDIIRANGERTAAMIPRGMIGRSLGSLQQATHEQLLTNVNRVFPLSIELYDIYSSQLNKRIAGEQLYAPYSREKRLRILAAIGMRETVKRVARLLEYLSAQSARTGKQDAIVGEATPSYDWSRAAGNTITVGTKWDASGDVMGDLDSAGDVIRQNGHMRMNVGIFGASAFSAAVNDSTFQTLSDNRRFGFVSVGKGNSLEARLQWMVDAGADFRGWIHTPKGRTIWAFTYDEGYTNSSGTYTPYMPLDEVLLFSSEARCDRYFGPPETLPMDSAMRRFYMDRFGMSPDAIPSANIKNAGVLSPRMFHFDAYGNQDHTTISHRTQCAPIFATVNVDSFALLDGCV